MDSDPRLLQADLALKAVAVATSFLGRLLRSRGTLTGQKCVSRRGGFAQITGAKARSPGREIVRGGSRKVGLLVVGRSLQCSQSTQHHRIALAMSHCLGTSCRIRVRNSPSRSLPEPKICLRAAAPQAAFAACSVAVESRSCGGSLQTVWHGFGHCSSVHGSFRDASRSASKVAKGRSVSSCSDIVASRSARMLACSCV